MKRFEFRLRSVLVLRQRLLNEAEQRYGAAIQKRRDAEQRLVSAQNEVVAMNDRVLALQGSTITAVHHEAYVGAIHRAKAFVAQMEELVSKAKVEEQKVKMEYIEANKNHDILVKLEEKQKQEHTYEELAKEQLLLDDLFNARRSMMNAAR